jgi:hypothetical protein
VDLSEVFAKIDALTAEISRLKLLTEAMSQDMDLLESRTKALQNRKGRVKGSSGYKGYGPLSHAHQIDLEVTWE